MGSILFPGGGGGMVQLEEKVGTVSKLLPASPTCLDSFCMVCELNYYFLH